MNGLVFLGGIGTFWHLWQLGSALRCFEAARQKDLDQAARREKDPPLQSSDVKSFDAVLRFKQCISDSEGIS
jgi:hypothetical protein